MSGLEAERDAAADAQERAELAVEATRDPAAGECNSPIPHAVHGDCPGLSPRQAHSHTQPDAEATAGRCHICKAERGGPAGRVMGELCRETWHPTLAEQNATLRAEVERLTGELADTEKRALQYIAGQREHVLRNARLRTDAEAELTKAQGDAVALRTALERNMPKHTLHHDWCDEEPCSCGIALLEAAT